MYLKSSPSRTSTINKQPWEGLRGFSRLPPLFQGTRRPRPGRTPPTSSSRSTSGRTSIGPAGRPEPTHTAGDRRRVNSAVLHARARARTRAHTDLLWFVEPVLVTVGEVEPAQLFLQFLLGLGELVQSSLQLQVTGPLRRPEPRLITRVITSCLSAAGRKWAWLAGLSLLVVNKKGISHVFFVFFLQ